MNGRFLTILSGVVGAAVLALGVGAAEPQGGTPASDGGIFDQESLVRSADDTTGQPGVQPQGRGPVNEAFAEPDVDRPQPSPVVPKPPPDTIEEMPPADKPDGDDVQWLGGYWAWDEERASFLWVSGIWRAIPPGRQWVPGHWSQVQDGWQWAPGFWGVADGGDVEVVPAPPDPEPETPPAAPSADSTFVPGTQVYKENKFVWQPGYYVTNRPGFVWVPARYVWTPCGYVFVDGYWDYDLENRGLLFAPVVIDPQFIGQIDWTYTPTFVVHDVCLLEALFVRRDCGCYFYGDYFDAGYTQLGYTSLVDYRVGKYGVDPLYGYYRWSHRNDRNWERRLQTLYTYRSEGKVLRPPHTLALQQSLGKRLLTGNTSRAGFQHTMMLGPVAKVDRGVVKLTKLDQTGQRKYKEAANLQRTSSQRREQAENKLVAQGQSAIRPGSPAQKLALNLPKSAAITRPGAGRTAPPPSPLVERKRNEQTTGNPGGNRPGGGNATPDVRTKTNPANNTAATPGGGRVNGNAGNTPTAPGGQKPNAGTTGNGNAAGGNQPGNPAGGKVNGNANGPAGNAANPGGNQAGARVNANPGTPATPANPGTGNAAGNPQGGRANGNANNAGGNQAGNPAGGRVNGNANGPGGNAANPGGNQSGARPNGNPGNPATPNPGAGNAAGNPGNPQRLNGNANGQGGARINPNPGNGAGTPNGGQANPNSGNPGGTPGGRKPAGEVKIDRPVRTPTTPTQAGNNGVSRPGAGVVTNQPPPLRVERSERPGGNAGAVRTPVVNATLAVNRVQRSFTPPSGPRVSNPTPVQFAAPAPRPVQTFSSPPRTSGGGGGGRRR
jgi:hypothetical protein